MVALGVNDAAALTPPRVWHRELAGLIDDIRRHLQPATIAISDVPSMHCFPAPPQPLAGALGLRAALLDAIAGWLGDALKVCVRAPREKGKANAGVIALLACAWALPNAMCVWCRTPAAPARPSRPSASLWRMPDVPCDW